MTEDPVPWSSSHCKTYFCLAKYGFPNLPAIARIVVGRPVLKQAHRPVFPADIPPD
ncbi:hypothetical protein H6G46_12030 [Synechocystis sp. FACHB-908]|nr:hypothetical protein [Synechocystis sp. FACHB-908]